MVPTCPYATPVPSPRFCGNSIGVFCPCLIRTSLRRTLACSIVVVLHLEVLGSTLLLPVYIVVFSLAVSADMFHACSGYTDR